MAEKQVIQGGPADGLPIAPGPRFSYIEVVAIKRTEPSAGAELYELRGGRYEYVGGRLSQCSCGCVFPRAEGGAERQPCPMCGAQPVAFSTSQVPTEEGR